MIRRIIFTSMFMLLTMNLATAAPRDTELVLNLLLSAANMTIPPKSSCGGEYGPTGVPKVKDLLAMELAYFNRGKNTIEGSCQGQEAKSCSLLIRHEYGEDMYGAQIDFMVREGVVDIKTLSCILTP